MGGHEREPHAENFYPQSYNLALVSPRYPRAHEFNLSMTFISIYMS